MSETRRNVSLDAALGAWPDVEKTEAEWENSARSIEARVHAGDRGATAGTLSDDELLSAPLGQMPEDGHNSASPEIQPGKGAPMTMQDRERDRRSLQDLAKMAQMGQLTPPPPSVSANSGVQRAAEAKKDDSGIVDLAAAAAADPGAEQRAQTTPLASQGLFDDEPASVRPPPSAAAMLQQPYPSVPPMPASSVPAPMPTPSAPPVGVAPVSSISSMPMQQASVMSSQVTALPQQKQGNGKVIAILVGGVVAAAAVAAGVVVFAKHKQAADAAALAAAQPKTETVAPKVEEPKKPEQPAVVAAADPTPAPEATLDPNALPNSAKPAAGKPVMAKAGGPAPAAAPAAPKNEELKVAQKDLPQNAGGPAGDLGAAIGAAVGPKDEAKQTPAAATNGPQFAAGSVPQKPSQGAITGAIGSVLPGARACLGPDDPVTYATITFASPGNVQSVSLSGGSASKASAASCIKDALTKARVAPFAEATYVTRVPVRP